MDYKKILVCCLLISINMFASEITTPTNDSTPVVEKYDSTGKISAEWVNELAQKLKGPSILTSTQIQPKKTEHASVKKYNKNGKISADWVAELAKQFGNPTVDDVDDLVHAMGYLRPVKDVATLISDLITPIESIMHNCERLLTGAAKKINAHPQLFADNSGKEFAIQCHNLREITYVQAVDSFLRLQEECADVLAGTKITNKQFLSKYPIVKDFNAKHFAAFHTKCITISELIDLHVSQGAATNKTTSESFSPEHLTLQRTTTRRPATALHESNHIKVAEDILNNMAAIVKNCALQFIQIQNKIGTTNFDKISQSARDNVLKIFNALKAILQKARSDLDASISRWGHLLRSNKTPTTVFEAELKKLNLQFEDIKNFTKTVKPELDQLSSLIDYYTLSQGIEPLITDYFVAPKKDQPKKRTKEQKIQRAMDYVYKSVIDNGLTDEQAIQISDNIRETVIEIVVNNEDQTQADELVNSIVTCAIADFVSNATSKNERKATTKDSADNKKDAMKVKKADDIVELDQAVKFAMHKVANAIKINVSDLQKNMTEELIIGPIERQAKDGKIHDMSIVDAIAQNAIDRHKSHCASKAASKKEQMLPKAEEDSSSHSVITTSKKSHKDLGAAYTRERIEQHSKKIPSNAPENKQALIDDILNQHLEYLKMLTDQQKKQFVRLYTLNIRQEFADSLCQLCDMTETGKDSRVILKDILLNAESISTIQEILRALLPDQNFERILNFEEGFYSICCSLHAGLR